MLLLWLWLRLRLSQLVTVVFLVVQYQLTQPQPVTVVLLVVLHHQKDNSNQLAHLESSIGRVLQQRLHHTNSSFGRHDCRAPECTQH